ncbi:MAG: hypothetical protein AB4290_00350 [Spirulina sp.]
MASETDSDRIGAFGNFLDALAVSAIAEKEKTRSRKSKKWNCEIDRYS